MDSSTLDNFPNNPGGPLGTLAIDAAGNLYGTTNNGAGSVFKLTPGNGGWTFAVLHSFVGGSCGQNPSYAGVTVDASGNIDGTTAGGGNTKIVPKAAAWCSRSPVATPSVTLKIRATRARPIAESKTPALVSLERGTGFHRGHRVVPGSSVSYLAHSTTTV